jgi:hypothetical protein
VIISSVYWNFLSQFIVALLESSIFHLQWVNMITWCVVEKREVALWRIISRQVYHTYCFSYHAYCFPQDKLFSRCSCVPDLLSPIFAVQCRSKREIAQVGIVLSIFSELFLTKYQACHGDYRFEQGWVFYEKPFGADGVQAVSHVASYWRFVHLHIRAFFWIFDCLFM